MGERQSVSDEGSEPTGAESRVIAEQRQDAGDAQEAGWGSEPDGGAVAAPQPLGRVPAETRAYRVQDDVPADGEQVAVALDGCGVEAALEDVAGEAMPVVECTGMRPVQPLHSL